MTGATGVRVLVVDNYDSFVYTLNGYLLELGATTTVVRNDAISEEDAAAAAAEYDAVLLSPGPGTPADAGVSIALETKIFNKMVNLSLPVATIEFYWIICFWFYFKESFEINLHILKNRHIEVKAYQSNRFFMFISHSNSRTLNFSTIPICFVIRVKHIRKFIYWYL